MIGVGTVYTVDHVCVHGEFLQAMIRYAPLQVYAGIA